MTNARIADVFDQLADLLEFQGANQFRVRAYRNAARTARDYPESLETLAAEGAARLTDIDGIGDDLAKKIVVLVETGELSQLNELLKQVPNSVLAMLRIPGLGPKKAAVLYKELGVKTLDELKAACEAGRVRELKGFAAKTEQTILAGISIAASGQERMYWATADTIVATLREHLKKCRAIKQLELELAREVRSDQYGIRTHVRCAGSIIKFEILLEARVALAPPGEDDRICGVQGLSRVAEFSPVMVVQISPPG